MAMTQADIPGRQRADFWEDFKRNQSVSRVNLKLDGSRWNSPWVTAFDKKKARRQRELLK